MDQEKVGSFIRNIRKRNGLTQKQFAEKYGVTYQAVSKWENGKNLPDISLLRKIASDYNVSIESIMDGKSEVKRKIDIKFIYLGLFIIAIILLILVTVNSGSGDFTFKTISSSCDSFIVNGSISFITSFISSLVTLFTALVFSCYMLSQKEYLIYGLKKVLNAYFSKSKSDKILGICTLSNNTFSKFVSGQCLEALILGVIFFVVLSIFRFPYALLISLLTSITLLELE